MERPTANWRNPADVSPPAGINWMSVINDAQGSLTADWPPTPHQARARELPSPLSLSLPQTLPGIAPLRHATYSSTLQPAVPPLPPLDPLAPPSPFRAGADRYRADDPEIDYHSQAEGMSDTDETCEASPTRRMPMANFLISDAEVDAAKRGLMQAGLDVDAAQAMAESTRQMSTGLAAEIDRLDQAVARRAKSADHWQDAHRHVQAAIEAEEDAADDARLRCESLLAGIIRDIVDHRETCNEARDALNAKLAVVQRIGRELCGESPVPTCPICWAEGISMVAQPCGHTYCDACCDHMMRRRDKKCYVCKRRCRGSIRIHLP